MDFGILYILSQVDFSLNANQIHRDLLIRNIALLDLRANPQPNIDMESLIVFLYVQYEGAYRLMLSPIDKKFTSDLGHMLTLSQEGSFDSIRKCEKLVREYIEMPTYDRIVRLLKSLKKDGLVVETKSGRGVVYGVPPEIKEEVLAYPAKQLVPKFRKGIIKTLPEFIQKSLS